MHIRHASHITFFKVNNFRVNHTERLKLYNIITETVMIATGISQQWRTNIQPSL